MYVNGPQKIFTYMGYYGNSFARESARNIERLARPMPQGVDYWSEVGERVKRVVATPFSLPLAAALAIPSLACYFLAAMLGRGRIEFIKPEFLTDWTGRSVKVMSLNACFQDPWSPLTGGVVPPFDPVGHYSSRIAAVVDAVARQSPDLFMGQEFDNLGAQDKFIRLMRQRGFRYFLRDLGSSHPIQNPSGLFVASKLPLQNIQFVPYPDKDKAGGAKWSAQGALAFAVSVGGLDLRLVNVHLNYGGEENQGARNRQMKNHVAPLLAGRSALFGDLNFNTSEVDLGDLGLPGFVNELEGQVTCTDAGKHELLGKSLYPNGKPCEDCREKIDGLIYRPDQIQVTDCSLIPLISAGKPLSDHYATVATLQVRV